MPEEITTTSLKSIFRFPFRGAGWQNRFVIGVALTFANLIIPIIPSLLVSGYTLRIMARAIEGEEPILPPWEDWGELLLDGLRRWLVSLVYLLPGTLVYLGGTLLYFLVTFGLPFSAAFAQDQRGLVFLFFFLYMLGIAALFLAISLGSMLLILGAIPLPVATAHFVAQGKLGAAFHVREWFRLLWANKLGYLIAFIIVAGLFAVAYTAAMIAVYTCILLPLLYLALLPFGFYLSLVSAVLFGQTYRESVTIAAGAI